MSDYTVAVTVTVNTWPANGGDITDFSISAVFDPNLPSGFLSCDSTGHFIAAMRSVQGNGRIFSPVSPGDKITFTFATTLAGLLVTDVTGLTGLIGGLAWGARSTSGGATSITATVTNANVNAGTTHTKYGISMNNTNVTPNQSGAIDPDFETDVTS